jgi:hypothetical protein
MYLTCVFSCTKKVTDNVSALGNSVLISYSASGAQLIRLTVLRDKPRNLRNEMTIRIDSTRPLALNMPQDILNLLPQFNTSRMTVCFGT